jgi:hypothetical protein
MLVSSKKRDESEISSEELTLIFDSFNDKENGLGFSTTPTGLRSDFTIAKDGLNMQDGFNMSWNTFWDVKTTRNNMGWFAEIRIPFSSMRFKNDKGNTVLKTVTTVCSRSVIQRGSCWC